MARFGRKSKEEQPDTTIVPELETKNNEMEQKVEEKQEPMEPEVEIIETKVESLEDFLF